MGSGQQSAVRGGEVGFGQQSAARGRSWFGQKSAARRREVGSGQQFFGRIFQGAVSAIQNCLSIKLLPIFEGVA